MFPSISPKQSFPALESEILAYWKANNTFQKSIDSRPEDNPYRFYDGPPFITGMPHYGSLLSSIVKDVVGRYWTMRGKRVERTWGWDCHGLPIEEKVQKKLGLKSNKEIEERGVKEFIDGCYEYTQSTSAEWDWYIDKIGRWVDMDHAYRTMDQDYMESVMWVFRQLWDKGLIYEGKRVSLYSWKLGTPISNFEVAMDDTYQEVNDPAITVKFRIPERDAAIAWVIDEDERFLMGWSYKYNGWHLVGGALDDGESLEDCVIREAEEEIGVKISAKDIEQVAQESQLDQGALWRATHFRFQIASDSIKNGEPEKFSEWKWFTKDELAAVYDDIYEVDKLVVDMYLGRAEIQKFAPPVYVLAWTTTPWTIPANMALAVRNDIDYILVENNGEQFIVAKNRAESVFKGKGEYTVIREFKGSELVGLGYVPPFPEYYYQKHGEKNHKIYHADFITDTDGTGIGHEAPEFGDVDFQLAKKEGIFISEAMDEAGKYTSQIFDYEGAHYLDLENPEKGANRINIERMKANGTLFKLEGITHRVPFCPRSGTPLMQKAQKSWFIDIQSQKEKLLKANEQINWFPEHLKFGRFAKGIESAPDWCISRTRYWGAPMPVWQNSDGSERVVVSSREEIFEMNKPYGQLEKREVEGKVKYFFKGGEFDGVEFNLHKPYIDSVLLAPKSKKSEKKVLTIHGKGSDIESENWKRRRDIFRKKGIELDMFQFDRSVDPTYESWKETFDALDFGQYDTVFTSSLGGQMIALYLLEKNIRIPRIVMTFPGMGKSTEEGNQPNLMKIWDRLEGKDLRVIADEILVFHAEDDEEVPFRNGERFAKQLGAIFVSYEVGGHNLWEQLPTVGEYIKYGKQRKVLGVHGYCRSDTVVDFLEGTRKNLEKEGIHMDTPLFEKGNIVTYANWGKNFDELDFSNYDTILTHSLGSRAVMNFIIEHKVGLDRLVMVAPGMESTTMEVQDFYDSLKADVTELKSYVKEVIVLASRDDVGREGKAKTLAELVGARYIEVDGYKHFNIHESQLIKGLVLHGEPLVRIPEVLDVWMDSGSMPYAQVHFPFAGFEDTSIRKGETDEEKMACFAFFEKMWKEEFQLDFKESKQGYDVVRERFFASNIYYIGDESDPESVIEMSHQIKSEEFIPAGASILGRIGTRQEMRGKGNGSKLIKKALSDLAKKGEKEVYVHAEVNNVEFYNGFGFIEIEDTTVQRGNTATMVMKKSLSKADELQALVFPADFIAEYVGQVRAWFYVMHVLGVLLNPTNKPVPTPSFTNVITTGVINGNDGRKMSKSFGNYPDPRATIEKYGADPIRFYMLNSPLLSGGDMDFKEEQIIDTVKGVMLPIWNTYSFFTTYANIDGWEKDNTEVWFTRHGESTSNVASTMSDGTDNPELTEKGKEQSRNASKILKDEGKNFDLIIHTSKIRAHNTAHIIGDEIGFTGEYIVDDSFIEQAAGEYARMTLDTMRNAFAKDNNMNSAEVTDAQIRTMYKNNSLENIEKFEKRILTGYENILNTYRGKKILIVAHAGTSRPILNHYFGKGLESAHYETKIGNAEPFRLITTPLVNDLDRWILSKLQVLMGQVHDAMDGYDVSRACRAIVEYMDHMTNWYVRLSRRRFWESGMTADKKSAYETLYTVLTELSKLLAPYMPFLSEDIFRGLTQKESVHLEYITRPSRHLIDSELNRDMEKCENIVSLGLALRSQKNIRVRQPLQSVTITAELSEYYQAIIRDELNVKEIKLENPEKLAKKIAKPDAKKIGPKYGKDVQIIIQQAKAGNFTENVDGTIVIARNEAIQKNPEEAGNTGSPHSARDDGNSFILDKDEYTLEYLPLEGVGDVIGGNGMVVAMDTTITEDLKLEGYARDIIRLIQDMRKEADYQVTDRISLHIYGARHEEILASYGEMIQSETLSTLAPLMVAPDLEKSVEVDESITLTLQIEK